MWEALIASAPVLLLLLFLPETNPAYILHHRAARLRKATRIDNIRSASEIARHGVSFHDVLVETLLTPAKITTLDPSMLFANLYMMLCYGIYYSFFESFPLVYPVMYDFDRLQQGLAFLPISIGSMFSCGAYTAYLHYYRVRTNQSQSFARRMNDKANMSFLLAESTGQGRHSELPRAGPHTLYFCLVHPPDWPPDLWLDLKSPHTLDIFDGRGRSLPIWRIHPFSRSILVPGDLLSRTRSESVCGLRCHALNIRSGHHIDSQAALCRPGNWRWLQPASWSDGLLHSWYHCALPLRAEVEGQVEVHGQVLT